MEDFSKFLADQVEILFIEPESYVEAINDEAKPVAYFYFVFEEKMPPFYFQFARRHYRRAPNYLIRNVDLQKMRGLQQSDFFLQLDYGRNNFVMRVGKQFYLYRGNDNLRDLMDWALVNGSKEEI